MGTQSSAVFTGRNARGRGFTLVELTISLAVLGLLSAVGVGTFQRVQVNSKDNAQLTTMSSLVREAQAQYPYATGTDRWAASLTTASADVMFVSASGASVIASLQRVDPVIAGTAYAVASTDVSYATRVDANGVATVGVASVSASGNCVSLRAVPNDIVDSWSWGRPLLAGSCTGASALLGPTAVLP